MSALTLTPHMPTLSTLFLLRKSNIVRATTPAPLSLSAAVPPTYLKVLNDYGYKKVGTSLIWTQRYAQTYPVVYSPVPTIKTFALSDIFGRLLLSAMVDCIIISSRRKVEILFNNLAIKSNWLVLSKSFFYIRIPLRAFAVPRPTLDHEWSESKEKLVSTLCGNRKDIILNQVTEVLYWFITIWIPLFYCCYHPYYL